MPPRRWIRGLDLLGGRVEQVPQEDTTPLWEEDPAGGPLWEEDTAPQEDPAGGPLWEEDTTPPAVWSSESLVVGIVDDVPDAVVDCCPPIAPGWWTVRPSLRGGGRSCPPIAPGWWTAVPSGPGR